MELTIEQALQRGIAAHREGKLQDAERLYRGILQSQPQHPDANHNLGVLAVSVNKVEAALPLFKTALEANPKIEQFWLSYIDALIKEQQFDNAKLVIEQAKTQGLAEEKLNNFRTQLAPKIQTENVCKGFSSNLIYEYEIQNFNDQKRLISAQVNGIKLINVYVPNGSSLNSEKFTYKIKWLNCLATFLEEQEKKGESIVLLGDFNIAPSDLDIHDPHTFKGGIMASEAERDALRDVLKGRFIDSFRIYEKNTGHWSWWDYRNNAYELNKGWRIDHIYISKNLSSKIKSCVIDRNPRENPQPSDHAPVMINLALDNQNEDVFDDDNDLFEI